MMPLNFFRALISAIGTVVTGVRKVSFPTLVVDLLGIIPSLVKEFQALLDMKKDGITPEEAQQIVDDGLQAFDDATGLDDNGVKKLSVIPGMPLDKQEETLDALKIVLRNLLYNKAKVVGYYE